MSIFVRPLSKRLLATQKLFKHIGFRRQCFSLLHLDPSIRGFTSQLAKRQPCIPIAPDRIKILSTPSHFLTLLIDMIQRAQHRIYISSLYIGSEESTLIDALHQSLENRPNLQVYLHLDFNRSTRPGPKSTARLLVPLLREFPTRVHVSLFRSPSLRGLLAKLVPPRFNEGWGTWHAKIYGADDNVIISGANLNKSYFTNRQDRYLHFDSQPHLGRYCFDFLQAASTFSYRLLPSNTIPPASGEQNLNDTDYVFHWPDQSTHPHHFHAAAYDSFLALQKSYRDSSSHNDKSGDINPESVFLFPIIQAGQFKIREEEEALRLLFDHLNLPEPPAPPNSDIPKPTPSENRPLLDLTSGYFGLYQPYQDLILACDKFDARIIAASPEANGFHGSRGISGRIPEGYTLLEQRFMKAVQRAGRAWTTVVGSTCGRGVQLREWWKHGWTYHAKGIWLSPTLTAPPILTLFGSTNLNSRSAHIDTELSFLMVIPSSPLEIDADGTPPGLTNEANDSSTLSPTMSLRQRLAEELDGLHSQTSNWKGGQRQVRLLTKAIVRIVRGML
ncbi:CDP-diacylglycerol-glycerol-3-phosphate 3-phosphatidyltransferase [Infundibulicybe gibba]|nr:CDP-diacylglycerol-glycerol-3-phosphate 3-phosphatidyltransferase [Infundibulicybe gibba]